MQEAATVRLPMPMAGGGNRMRFAMMILLAVFIIAVAVSVLWRAQSISGIFERVKTRFLRPTRPQYNLRGNFSNSTRNRMLNTTATTTDPPVVCPPPPPPIIASLKRGISAYVLFGARDIDLKGAIRHAEAIPYIYPGCRMLVYIDQSSVPLATVGALEARNVTIIRFNPAELPKMGWNITTQAFRTIRYWAINLPDWDYMIFRDLDSGLWFREKSAVDEWLLSGIPFHSMRDHPAHWWAVMGGMWGVTSDFLKVIPFNLTEKMRDYLNTTNNHAGTDQMFLSNVVWPVIKHETMAHDSYYCESQTKYPHLLSKVHWGFPTKRLGKIIAANYAFPDGSPVDVTAELPELPVPCRRRPEWTYG